MNTLNRILLLTLPLQISLGYNYIHTHIYIWKKRRIIKNECNHGEQTRTEMKKNNHLIHSVETDFLLLLIKLIRISKLLNKLHKHPMNNKLIY